MRILLHYIAANAHYHYSSRRAIAATRHREQTHYHESDYCSNIPFSRTSGKSKHAQAGIIKPCVSVTDKFPELIFFALLEDLSIVFSVRVFREHIQKCARKVFGRI